MMMHPRRDSAIILLGLIFSAASLVAADALDTWTERRPAADGFYLRDIIFAQDKFVTVGTAGSVLTSPDGREWTPQQLPEQPNILADIAYGKGLLVAVGSWNQSGIIFTNGQTWQTASTSSLKGELSDVTFGNGLFVAVGSDLDNQSLVVTSTNSTTWVRQSVLGVLGFNRVAFGNSTFVAVGRVGNVSTSDGMIWRQRNPGPVAGLNLFGVLYARSSFWIVGQSGGIWQSSHYAPLLLRATGSSPDGFTLTLDGEMGRSFSIQASSDAAHGPWQELGVVVTEQESSSFTDKAVAGAAARFYRAQPR